MKKPLHFRELTVRRMPGYPLGGPQLRALSPGINLVRGPNASGKSTTARALQALLWHWPDGDEARGSLRGRFTLGGDDWEIDVDGARAVWQRGGTDHSAPPLPHASARGRYLLSLHELLRAEDGDLAERIRVESAGGFDVRAAAKEAGFAVGGRRTGLVTAWKQARAALETASQEAARLRGEQEQLDRFRREAAHLTVTAAGARALEAGRELARASERLADAEREVGRFPELVARLRGHELDRIVEWRESLMKLGRGLENSERERVAALERRAKTGLPGDGVPDTLLPEAKQRLQQVQQLSSACDVARTELASARAHLAGREGAEVIGSELEAATLEALDRHLSGAERIRAQRAALDAESNEFVAEGGGPEAEAPPAAGSGAVGAGVAAEAAETLRKLRLWLRTPQSEARARLDRLILGGGLGLLGVGVAVLLHTFLGERYTIAGIVIGLAALILGVLLLLLRPPAEPDRRAAIRAEVDRTRHGPDGWTVEAVERRVGKLEQEAVAREWATTRARDRADRRRRLATRRAQVEKEERDFRAQRSELVQRLGLPSGVSDLELVTLGHRIVARDKAAREAAAAAEKLRDVERQFREELDRARAQLAAFGYAPTDPATLSGALTDLERRREVHRDATRDLAHAEGSIAEARAAIDDTERAQADLLESLGLHPDEAEERLAALLQQRPDHAKTAQELHVARNDADRYRARLEQLAAEGDATASELWVAPPTGAGAAPLDDRLAEARAAAERLEQVRKQIGEIEGKLAEARRRHDTEAALAAHDDAVAALAADRERAMEAAVGEALAGWLRERESDNTRPAVFHRAREILGEITRHRYSLDLADGGGDGAEFRARDTTTDRVHTLEQLSAGTRLQLLLAVRVAFVETQEAGATLPLLLDEVLANSDDHRARAIIEAAIALARGGRQLFYFTAQADELAKWREHLEAAGVEWKEHDLAAATGDESSVEWTGRAGAEAVPVPDGDDHAAYGRRLGVAPLALWGGSVGGLHLWHLVDDVDDLHGLLRLGVPTWGQLRAFHGACARQGTAAPPVVARSYAAAEARARLCEQLLRLLRKGRGRPVDRTVLEASGAVSDTWIDRASELCRELEGRGDCLLAALEEGALPRFRSQKINELEAYLRDNGHLSDDETLTDDEILLRMTAMAAGSTPGLDRDGVARLVERLLRGPPGADAPAAGQSASGPSVPGLSPLAGG